ncbi:MAG TPA: DEAD/DEAH box helicase [Limnochordia bacterium]
MITPAEPDTLTVPRPDTIGRTPAAVAAAPEGGDGQRAANGSTSAAVPAAASEPPVHPDQASEAAGRPAQKRSRRRKRQGSQPAPSKAQERHRAHSDVPDFASLGIRPPLLKALKRMGFRSPTEIQARTIPLALAGRDVIGQSHTGSGKTCAFAIPILQRLQESGGLQALIITPTRELAIQVVDEIDALARYTPARLLAAFGGGPIDMQIVALRHGVDILVGTPGRLLDLIYRGELDFGHLRCLVLDEADEMLDMGFLEDVERIVSCLPEERQTLLFSATVPAEIRDVAARLMRDPVFVQVQSTQETVPAIRQLFIELNNRSRTAVLREILADPEVKRAIVFCRTKLRAARLASELGTADVAALHGDMSQPERNRVMNQFRRGQLRVLVATDVVSRGIDVEDVTHVINYDCPDDVESYVHRVGRTARAGRSGTALTLIDAKDRRRAQVLQRYARRQQALSEGAAPEEGARPQARQERSEHPEAADQAAAQASDGTAVGEASPPKKSRRGRRRRRRPAAKREGAATGSAQARS